VGRHGHGLPDGYDGAMVQAVAGHEHGIAADTLSVMAAAVKEGRQGRGLAGRVLTALRERAAGGGLSWVIAPVRPTLKSRYPLTPMERFARWTRADGLHLDPWIRTHQRVRMALLEPRRRASDSPPGQGSSTNGGGTSPGQSPACRPGRSVYMSSVKGGIFTLIL
jgi:GNAT superfamily N-acetyltransferase